MPRSRRPGGTRSPTRPRSRSPSRCRPPPAYEDLPGPAGADVDEADEEAEIAEGLEELEEAEPLLPEEVSAEDLFEEEPSEPVEIPEAGVGPEAAAEEPPAPEAIEAAAEHFASGVRDTPDAVERDLLADLEGAPEPDAVTVAPPAAPVEAPSWQEGADAVVEEPVGAGPRGRNLPAAVASGGSPANAQLAALG